MSIKTMTHSPYTSHRDYVALSADLSELPHNCGDGSTCIMSDSGTEYVFYKDSGTWKEEKRPVPEYIWLGEWTTLTAINNPVYGSLAAIKGEGGRQLYWFNGIVWKELVEKEN